MAKAKTPRAPREIVKSRDEAVSNFRAAAEKHLTDRPESERQAWAEKTADAYIKRGLIAVVA